MQIVFYIVAMLFFLSGSSRASASGAEKYYRIRPDNFIDQWEFKGDTLLIVRLNPEFRVRGGDHDTAILIIHETVTRGTARFFYIEEPGIENRFSVITLVKESGHISFFPDHARCATMVECKNKPLPSLKDQLYFSLYAPAVVDSFRKFRNIKELDKATACTLVGNLIANLKASETKIRNIAKYDMYLSGSSKEIVNRTMISMQINPLDYTTEESNALLKQCEHLIPE